MSQWQNTTAMQCMLMPYAYIQVTAEYNNRQSSKQLFNVPAVNLNYSLLLLIAVATDQRLCWWVVVEAGPTGAHSVLEIIQTHDSSHRTAGYSCQLFDISGTFAGPKVVFLTAYQFSYMLNILFRADSRRPSATGLPRDRVRCVNLAQKISNRTDFPLLVRKLFTNMFCTSSLSWRRCLIDNLSSFMKAMFINKLWCNNDVTLMTLHCVFCRVGSLHLLGFSFRTLENICTKFTHISQKWLYFSMHYTFYLHISLEDVTGSDVGGWFLWPTL